MKTFVLKDAAKMILGDDTTIKYPATWVWKRISRGQFHAYRVGRLYCMSRTQIDEARNLTWN